MVVGIGILACLCFCPREYTEVGLVVALMLIPGVTGLGLLAILQLIWWRRHRALHPVVRRRAFQSVISFALLIVIGCVILFGQFR